MRPPARAPRLLLLLLLLLPLSSARAQGPSPLPLAVLPLESSPELAEQARSVHSLLASHLGETPQLRVLTPADVQAVLGLARERELLGSCAAGSCADALASAAGARYVVTGRLDRQGQGYVLTTALLDSVEARPVGRPRANAADAAGLGAAADEVARALVRALRAAPGEPLPFEGELSAGLRVNNSFVSRLRALNPGGDVELGYRFHPAWMGFVQVGLSLVRAGGENEGRLNVVPSVLGVRHFHRLQAALQPYWGLGLGLQLSFGQYGVFSETGTLPTVLAFGGLEYRVGPHLGLQLETGTNLAQALLGFGEEGLGNGVNLDLNAGVTWHF